MTATTTITATTPSINMSNISSHSINMNTLQASTHSTVTENAMTNNSNSVPGMIGSRPTLITRNILSSRSTTASPSNKTTLKFLIMDAPRNSNLHLYIREFQKHHVTDVVRVCEPTYAASGLDKAGIHLHEMPYSDGHSPPQEVLDRWLNLVHDRWLSSSPSISTSPSAAAATDGAGGSSATPANADNTSSTNANVSRAAVSNSVNSSSPCIAVHCVAGLGRAPVMVAIALIEFADMDPVEAVTLIRKHRRGAINDKQLNWLEQYQKTRNTGGDACCVMM